MRYDFECLDDDFAERELRVKCYLIHDRDPLFTRRFVKILEAAGVKSAKLPARSPNLNPYAEKFVLSARRECLNKVIPFGEKHLRKIVVEFVDLEALRLDAGSYRIIGAWSGDAVVHCEPFESLGIALRDLWSA